LKQAAWAAKGKILDFGFRVLLNCKFMLHLCPYYQSGVAGTATGRQGS
jgi:hypothetical protein